MPALRPLLVAALALAAFSGTSHATTVCRSVSVFGGACVEANAPGGTGPTARVSCGGAFWECKTITIP